jgi:excinuclease UvrABC helicase subunit UvrB
MKFVFGYLDAGSGSLLLQMIGGIAGQVVMYADNVTDSMKRAISETNS